METRNRTLEEAQQKLQRLYNKNYEQEDNSDNSFWNRLNDYASKFNSSQLKYVNESKEVIEAEKKMKDLFMVFLFEKFKSSFVSVEAFKPVCNEYIDTVIKVGNDYDSYNKSIEEENKQLKSRLAELERQAKNAGNKPNTK